MGIGYGYLYRTKANCEQKGQNYHIDKGQPSTKFCLTMSQLLLHQLHHFQEVYVNLHRDFDLHIFDTLRKSA